MELRMSKRFIAPLVCMIGLGFFFIDRPAHGYIQTEISMKQVLAQTQVIFAATVESFDPAKRTAVIVVDEMLKGKAPFNKLHIALPEDREGAREFNRPSHLLKRLAVKQKVVFFVDAKEGAFAPIRRGNLLLFLYANGTWVQFAGTTKEDAHTSLPIAFHHFEPYLRRTFKGTTAEMRLVIIDGLSGKNDPPKYDPKEPGGIGPEVIQYK
jgi:hypothetical protein